MVANIKYPAYFADVLPVLYPTLPIMVELAKANSYMLCRYLEQSYSTGIANHKIIAATTLDDLAKLKVEASFEERKKMVYLDCIASIDLAREEQVALDKKQSNS